MATVKDRAPGPAGAGLNDDIGEAQAPGVVPDAGDDP